MGIRVTHVPRSVNQLSKDGLIYESVTHVKGMDKRRKAYFLTEQGLFKANEIKRILEERTTSFIGSDGQTKEVRIGDIEKLTGIKIDLLELMTLIDEGEPIGQTTLKELKDSKALTVTEEGNKIYDFPHKVPIVKELVGRKEDQKLLKHWIESDDYKMIVVNGKPGIGKTTLIAHLVSGYEDEKHVFWFELKKKDDLDTLIKHLTDFLGRINKSALKSALRGRKSPEVIEMINAFKRDLKATDSLVVIDAFDNANDDITDFFVSLLKEIDDVEGVKIIITQRKPLLRPHKIPEEGKIGWMELEGLDKKSCKKLIGAKDLEEQEFDRIYTLTEGNPMMIKLIKTEDVDKLIKEGKYTADELTLIKYLRSLDKV